MDTSDKLVVFTLDEQQYALHLSVVHRVVRMVEITPLPKAPEIIHGVIDMQGHIIPVVNIRKRFRLPEREVRMNDQLIIAYTSKRTVAIAADAVESVVEHTGIVPAEEVVPGLEYVEGVTRLEGGIVLIHDLDRFLSLDEEKLLDDAMKES